MSEKKARPHLVAGLLLIALVILLTAGSVQAQSSTPQEPGAPASEAPSETGPPIPHTLIGHSNCLICHAEGFKGANIIPADHAGYENEECQRCHEPSVVSDILPSFFEVPPGELPPPIPHPPADGQNTCFDCHVKLGDKHTEISEQWEKSVHGKAEVGCADCHGGDPRTDEMNLAMLPDAGYIGVPPRIVIPEICGGCHSDVERMRQYNLPTDQYVKYVSSVHGSKVKQGDIRVAICVDCHGAHDVKKASDPSADVYPLNIPKLCARCHSDADLMEPYNIPTDQYDLYKNSIHGQRLLNDQYLRAPSCASCHGSHGARPPDDEEVVNVCGKCHTATEDYYQQSRHYKIGENAPKCWTCHGTHDVFKTDESLFIHQEPRQDEEKYCGSCHVDEKTFRMNKERFERPEDRRCDTCHHEGSRIMVQVLALYNALTEANRAYLEAEETIQRAVALGMIVTEAESKLAAARTSLIRARAATHTTKLPVVTELTDDATASALSAQEIAADKVAEYIFRRRSMVVAVGIIVIIVATLSVLRRELYRQLQEAEGSASNGSSEG
ncbi:MAG: hypothetical protein GXP39_05445 [Chloroflexi bacterium]|nr:hypothetical protein [Chloroflexota bacterium]